MVFKTIVQFTGSKRIPLIKFRKGGYNYGGGSSNATTSQGYTPGAIEDWELPPRYWRKPIDPTEMDYINRGGPA